MRFGLKKLLPVVTVCCIAFAMLHSAGFWVAVGVFVAAWLLRWAIITRRRKYWLVLRCIGGLLSLVAIWFLAVDWSWFIWDCHDCKSEKEIIQYRILGLPISQEDYYTQSFFNETLTDLGVPCPHEDTSYFHKHRFWGLTLCACPCWNGSWLSYGVDERYTSTIAAKMRELGRADPSYAKELQRRVIKEHDYRYFWDAFMLDEMVRGSMKDKTTHKPLLWLKESTAFGPRWIGENTSQEELASLIHEIYSIGALDVLAFDVKSYKAVKSGKIIYEEGCIAYKDAIENPEEYPRFQQVDVQETDVLAIKLPQSGSAREVIFNWYNAIELKNGNSVVEDYGQSFLLFYVE